ncbi:RdgB/HAM1 family non-canonical purine NTP pyrophosphatase [Alicyclobacillus sp. ALC3]|uniref:RdgB/HAM1 family non-canonical purine NTP pyrophosphatase n=1 Tax=Alicyclobacillus sp. ALC3 TaxID=2796143 RepID=UPI0023784FEA|nr:RdgB/HAM1 family non-canonical purine NTP pyrophosphatase [Alicyclobacillus sp. ALC3]
MVWLASRNDGKVAEFAQLLAHAQIRVKPLPNDAGTAPETGTSFEANAVQKALYYGDRVDGWVLSDDSGLCVEGLSGQPGVYSARFAGEFADDEANNRKLLTLMEDIPTAERTASFVCVLALWHRGLDAPVVARGEVHGSILRGPSGTDGFGYDPLFVPNGFNQSFAELSMSEKNLLSHRTVAVHRLLHELGGDMLADLRRE